MADHDIRVTVRPGAGDCLYCEPEMTWDYDDGGICSGQWDEERECYRKCAECGGRGHVRCLVCDEIGDREDFVTLTREPLLAGDPGEECTVCAEGDCMAIEAGGMLELLKLDKEIIEQVDTMPLEDQLRESLRIQRERRHVRQMSLKETDK